MAIEKIKTGFSENFEFVLLNREDIEKILQVIKKHGVLLELTSYNPSKEAEFKYDTLDEIFGDIGPL